MQNKEFVTEFKRIVEQDLANQIPNGLYNINVNGFNLYLSAKKKMEEIKAILGTGTSDLIRCPDAVVERNKEVNYRDSNRKEVEVLSIITFNHKGPGILKVSTDPNWASWGTTYSKEMSNDEMIQHFSDPAMVATITKNLTDQNRRKMLKTFTDVATTIPELVQLMDQLKEYHENVEVKITAEPEEHPIEIMWPTNKLMNRDSQLEEAEVMHMQTIRVTGFTFGSERSHYYRENLPSLQESSSITVHGKYNDVDNDSMNFHEVLSLTNNAHLLILMQFPDQLKAVMKIVLQDIHDDSVKQAALMDSVNLKLAPYMLCRLLADQKDSKR